MQLHGLGEVEERFHYLVEPLDLSRDDLDLNKQLIELVVNAGLMVLTQRPITGTIPAKRSRVEG